MTKQEILTFASEAEEAAWWYENREKHESHFEQALLEGRLRRGSIAQRLAAMRGETLVNISPEDAAIAAQLAMKKGVEVKSYLLSLLHNALQEEVNVSSKAEHHTPTQELDLTEDAGGAIAMHGENLS